MKAKMLLASLVVCPSLLTGSATQANAATIKPVPPVTGGNQLPPGRCTVETLNVGGIVNADGSMFVTNVPSNQGQVRLRAACTDPLGNTVTGQSALVQAAPGMPVDVGPIDFGSAAPVAAKLTVAPQALNLNGVGTSQQLAVKATFANQSTGNVTAASTGTAYQSSNLAVAAVSPNGQITAVGPGTAIISAFNQGARGLATVTVRSASLTNLAITPASVKLSLNPAFRTQPAQLRVLGSLSDGKTIDLSSASSGTLYSSSAPGIAAVSPDGTIVGVANGSATITVTDPQSGTTKQVPVTVSAFSPVPIGAYDTPGFAYNVDIDGSRIFVADGAGGLQIFNAGSSTVIGKLAFLNNQVFDVKVRGTVAAVALGTAGFALVDVSDPSKPQSLSKVSSTGSINDLWVSGNRLYAAALGVGLKIYDISNPTAPTLIGTYPLANAFAVAADSTRDVAVVATTGSTLSVIRTSGSPPWSAVTVSLPTGGETDAWGNYAADVSIFGTSAYVSNGLDGVREVDLTDPTKPVLKAHSTMSVNPGNPNAVGVAVSQSSQGLLVAAADWIFFNAVPLFDSKLNNTFTLDFSTNVPPSYIPVQLDANGTGIALGNGIGVVTVGTSGIQVFRTQQLTDNSGIAPTVSVTEPTNSSGVLPGQLTTINATATDDVGVSLVEFLVGGNVVAVAVAGTAPFSGDFVPGASCTTQIIKARATDTSGNIADSLPVSIKVLCAEGQPCSTGTDCANNVCAGGVCNAPCNSVYASCKAVHVACPTSASGPRTLDPDGAGPQLPFQTYCDMTLDGGGWTLVAKMTNQDAKQWVNSKSSWSGSNSYGNTANLSIDQDAKSKAWSVVPAEEFMLTDSANYASGSYIQTTSNCLGNTTLSQFFNGALANYPNTSGQTEYKKCSTFNNYVPDWTVEPNWLSQTPSSPSNSLSQGYLIIAKTDATDSQGVISFYADGDVLLGPNYSDPIPIEPQASVGLGPSAEYGQGFGTYLTFQDIGGPLSCYTNDVQCRTDYPQTVFMFVR